MRRILLTTIEKRALLYPVDSNSQLSRYLARLYDREVTGSSLGVVDCHELLKINVYFIRI
jgi:hypothetical protein